MEAANKVFEQAMEAEDDIVLPVTGNELKNIEKADFSEICIIMEEFVRGFGEEVFVNGRNKLCAVDCESPEACEVGEWFCSEAFHHLLCDFLFWLVGCFTTVAIDGLSDVQGVLQGGHCFSKGRSRRATLWVHLWGGGGRGVEKMLKYLFQLNVY